MHDTQMLSRSSGQAVNTDRGLTSRVSGRLSVNPFGLLGPSPWLCPSQRGVSHKIHAGRSHDSGGIRARCTAAASFNPLGFRGSAAPTQSAYGYSNETRGDSEYREHVAATSFNSEARGRTVPTMPVPIGQDVPMDTQPDTRVGSGTAKPPLDNLVVNHGEGYDTEGTEVTPELDDTATLLQGDGALGVDREAQTAAASLFTALNEAMPGLVQTHTPLNSRLRPSNIVARMLSAHTGSTPFHSLPFSGEVRHTLAHTWHGIVDARRRPALGTEGGDMSFADAVLSHVGGTNASLSTGGIPTHPRVDSPMYMTQPPDLLAAFPVVNEGLGKPKQVLVPFGHFKSLMEDWRNVLRVLSFMDNVTGAMARVAVQGDNLHMVTMASSLGSAVGDIGRAAAHGYLSSLVLARDAVLYQNRDVECLTREVKAARVAPPLLPEMLPGAVLSEQEVLVVRKQKAEQEAWGSLHKGLKSLATRPGPPHASSSMPKTTTHPKAGRGRGNKHPRGNQHPRGAGGGASRGRGRGRGGPPTSFSQPARGARGGAARGKH